MTGMTREKTTDEAVPFYCSFFDKSQHEVGTLIAGPRVFICNECADICTNIFAVRAHSARDQMIDQAVRQIVTRGNMLLMLRAAGDKGFKFFGLLRCNDAIRAEFRRLAAAA